MLHSYSVDNIVDANGSHGDTGARDPSEHLLGIARDWYSPISSRLFRSSLDKLLKQWYPQTEMDPRIVKCARCGKAWATRNERPVRCRWCRTPYWDSLRRGSENGPSSGTTSRTGARGSGGTKTPGRPVVASAKNVCKHGKPKGFNCWQCGGIAVINKEESCSG